MCVCVCHHERHSSLNYLRHFLIFVNSNYKCFILLILLAYLHTRYLSQPPHQTGLDPRSMTRRSIIVGVRGGKGQAQAEAQALLDYGGHQPT